jgi:hypothetical protein
VLYKLSICLVVLISLLQFQPVDIIISPPLLTFGRNTEPATPAHSGSCIEDMSTDEVEDFKNREYPQLKGKTYLDHGGTTVCRPRQGLRLWGGMRS